ncbi:MAG: helicase HerA-like domain-containing protein, partial [Candidatus Nanohalobium sp.]
LGPGKTVTVAYNVTVDKYVSPQTVARDIKISYDSGTKYLNDTVVTVPEEKAIKTSPDNISAAIPVNQGDVNITSITTKNIGNADVTLEFSSNDTGAEVYFGSSKLNKYSVTISPGNTDSVKARSDTSALELGEHLYKVKPVPSSGSLDQKDPINLTVFAQDIGFEIKNQNKTTDIVAGDQIETSFNLTQKGKAINSSENVDIKLLSGDSTYDIEETFSNSSKLWTANFQAPDIEDGINHTFKYEVSSSAFKSKLSASKEVNYKDVTPPKFVNLTAEPVKSGENSTIKVKLKDKSDIIGEDVTANILTPDGSSSQLRLDPVGSTRLSETQSKKWVGEFNATTRKGLYNVTVKATDSAGNTGESGSEYFRVFQPLNVSGDAADPANSTEIRLIDEGGDVAEKVDPENGRYNETIKSGTYSEVEVQFTKDKIASLESLSAGRINRSPPKFDARINENRLNVDKQYLSGFALVSKTFDNVSGELSFDYSDYIDRIDYQGNLQVMKCEEYNISKARPCQSSYETISKNNTFINAKTRNLYINNISGFSSYILVEDESSSQSNNLNVNLTGELGNFSDLSNLDSLLQQVASNTQNLGSGGGSSGGGSTGSGSGSGGGGSGSSGGGGLGQLASQLNKSEDKLAIGNSKISVNIQPGQKKSTAISIQNPKDKSVNISLEATRNIREMLSFNKSFDLKSGEFRTVKITVDASNKSKLKEFSGFIQVKGDSSDRSIPVNIDIVGADKRLLDVSLQPTVDSFRPGKTARIKLSFSNQGFTRAVDAETTISIVDITDDEVIAKETHTYAVQTTLDKVVSLEIPKGTDLGTYEARATVEYSNIPGNRSATAVGQVEVQRPFWQRQTLGLANVYWLGILLLLIAAGSGGGYWYYRKKKLEAKRSRFEEQVDNDAIPSEAGRTAFVGELSEIGTRAFIDLNDLMTHCLTAGATGAGKSVAAQVIVEEALEQGVNVIVLDPTGQWSGYLDKNENDEFFAFYDDFGMKESDARSYQGNIRAVDADQDTIDITDIMRPEGDEGSIHVFSMHKLENAELEEYLSDTIQQIFDYNPEEKDELKTLIVYDEAHRVLEKFGGTGRGVKMLERGAREFRKWGTGMLMISQVIDDFPEEVRANIGTQIQMRTEYEGDLDRIERKYGNNITQGVTKADTGTGM